MKKEKHKGKPKIPGKRETKGNWKKQKEQGQKRMGEVLRIQRCLWFQTCFRLVSDPQMVFVNLGNWKEEVNEEETNRQTCNGRKGRNCLVCDKTEIE